MPIARRTPFQKKDIRMNALPLASVILRKTVLIEFGIFEKPFQQTPILSIASVII